MSVSWVWSGRFCEDTDTVDFLLPLPHQVLFALLPSSSSVCGLELLLPMDGSGLPLVALGCVLMSESGLQTETPSSGS